MRQRFLEFLKDENGQTTTEYFLMITVAITLVMQFRKRLNGVFEALFGKINRNIDELVNEDP